MGKKSLRGINRLRKTSLSGKSGPRDLQCAPDGSPKLRVLTHALPTLPPHLRGRCPGCNPGSPLPCLGRRLVRSNHHPAGCPEVHGLSESARSKNMVAALYPPTERAISCLQAAGPRAIAAGGVCLLLKAIGASEGWRNAIRYHTRSLSQPARPAVGGLFFAPKGACPSPKTANWPPP
jgi:hypothetical protein